MERTVKRASLVAAFAISIAVLMLAVPVCQAHATAYKSVVGIDSKAKIGKTTFKVKQYYDGAYYCKVTMKKNGKSKTVAKKACPYCVTNGKYLYYAKVGTKTNSNYVNWQTVYKKNLKTGKQKKIIAGWGYEPRACSGTYLYCGGYKEGAYMGIKLYAVNVKTKKKTFMRNAAGKVQYKSGKVIATTNSGDASNYPLYVFNKNGKGRKQFAKGVTANIKGKRIYYCVMSSEGYRYKVYSCNLKGKGKKAVTGWTNDFPSKYFE